MTHGQAIIQSAAQGLAVTATLPLNALILTLSHTKPPCNAADSPSRRAHRVSNPTRAINQRQNHTDKHARPSRPRPKRPLRHPRPQTRRAHLEYIGHIHGPAATGTDAATTGSHEHSDYDLSLDRYVGLGIDADRMGNEARFINDYRGVRERPNAEFREMWVPTRGAGERAMGVWVLGGKGREKGIRKGEEICVSYGRGFWGARKGEAEEIGEIRED